MSITEHELTTIRECLQQLRNCSEFLLESVGKIENDIKSYKITSQNESEHTKDYDRLRRSLRKVYKEAKQRIHDVGKDSKDADSTNIDASSVTEEDGGDETADPLSAERPQSTTTASKSERPLSVISNGFEHHSSGDEIKTKIRLVAIEKLLDPKMMASSPPPPVLEAAASNPKPSTNSSIIVLDSDDDEPPTPPPPPQPQLPKQSVVVPVVNEKKKESSPKSTPKTKPLKVRIARNRIIERMIRKGRRIVKLTELRPASRNESRQKRDKKIPSIKKNRVVDDDDDDEDSNSNGEKSRRNTITEKSSSRNEVERTIDSDDDSNESKQSKKQKSDDDDDSDFVISRKKKRNERSAQSSKAKSDSESSADEPLSDLKPKRKRIRRNSSGSDSSTKNNSDDDDDFESDDDDGKRKRKRKRKDKKKKTDKSGDDENDEDKTNRKNIRKVITTKNLDDETKRAAEAEKLRIKRLEERQKLYNKIFEKPETTEIDQMVLDFDEETKEELLSIDKGLIKKMKPHQVQGVRFMWDACFETIKDIDTKEGSGCILGHCMGLGKSLQVVALAHTLLTNSDKTRIETVLVITPLSTVQNWAREFHMWMRYCKNKDVEVYDMSKFKDKKLRVFKLKEWHEDGGVCIMGYDMYRILSNPKMAGATKKMRESLQASLVDPGPDLIVCDEGHLLKNEKTSISQAVSRVRTKRRIVLSGTPLQNNLKEYYCMVQFVKPNLLGTYKEYMNRFVNPITNGQYTDSTERDTRLMRHRSHVLHKMLDGCIQRRDYSVLAPYLPPKYEYVVFIALSDIQKQLYEQYMTKERTVAQVGAVGSKSTALFRDFQTLRRIWTHPMGLRINSDDARKKRERKALQDDDENSLEDFIVEDDEETSSESEHNSSDSDSDLSKDSRKKLKSKKSSATRRTRQNPTAENEVEVEEEEEVVENEWWMTICPEKELRNLNNSPKLMLLFEILQESAEIGDKVLLFSQSLQSLAVIEAFLALIDRKSRGDKGDNDEMEYDVNGFTGSWKPGLDYFRLDGSNTVDSREHMCKRFNDTTDYRARLFLISTRAGSLGINLVAANRVIIFDASWNPSHDTQSIFRVYRFGQDKPCYIYRFIAYGTMEAKIYERQVTKQATAKRVIDEQQIGRHYNSNDIMELYRYDLENPEVREVPILPKDRLFADLIKKYEKRIIKYHEHDSLLENKDSENLSEEERKAAWAEYETEKNQPAPSAAYVQYTRPIYRNGPVTSSKIFGFRSDVLLQLLNLKVRRDYPQASNIDVGQLVPTYLRQLYEEMNQGNPTLYNELNEMHRSFETPVSFVPMGAANPVSSNFIVNPFYQPPPTQNMEPAYIHEID